MMKLKKILRIISLVILLLLAVTGVALVPIFPRREPMNKEATIELVEAKEDEELP